MTFAIPIPGGEDLRLDHLMLDVNGTLTNRGALLDGVTAAVAKLLPSLDIHLVSADTLGTLDSIADLLRATGVRAASGDDKLRTLDKLGPQQTAVIGNGANDVLCSRRPRSGSRSSGPRVRAPRRYERPTWCACRSWTRSICCWSRARSSQRSVDSPRRRHRRRAESASAPHTAPTAIAPAAVSTSERPGAPVTAIATHAAPQTPTAATLTTAPSRVPIDCGPTRLTPRSSIDLTPSSATSTSPAP